MIYIKRIILLGLFLFFIQLVQSQSTDPYQNYEERLEQKLTSIKGALGLDELQYISVKSVLLKYHHKSMEVANKQERSDIMSAQMQELQMQQDTELLKFIAEDQLTKLKALMKDPYGSKKVKKNKQKGKGKRNN